MLRTTLFFSCFLAVTASSSAADTRVAAAEPTRHEATEIMVALTRCDGGDAVRCFDAADDIERFRLAVRREYMPDELRARGEHLLDRQCDRGEATACLRYSEVLRVARDFDRALEKLGRACELQSADACLTLGNRTRDGGRSKQNLERAIGFFEKACNAGSSRGCVNLADELSSAGTSDPRAIEKLYRKACSADNAAGCTGIAEAQLLAGNRKGAYLDYARACMLEQSDACFNAGTLAPNEVRARWMFLRACEGKFAKGCSKLSDLLLREDGGDRDLDKAISFAERACELDNVSPCKRAAQLRRQNSFGASTAESTVQSRKAQVRAILRRK